MQGRLQESKSERPPEGSPGGLLYGDLIREALAEERARKESLERRGVVMVSASAFLSTLVLSLLTFRFANISELPGLETATVWVALVGFVVAAFLGLAANVPVGLSEPTIANLEKINEQAYWDNSQEIASHFVNKSRLLTLTSYRQRNGTKAKVIAFALGAETIGVIALAVLILALII